MRILAIRGKNLASLAGPFAISFDSPPLSDAGLFAIVGPTGAGKSTLLDALCLALFNRTPRLNDRGGFPVGLEAELEATRLRANDARAILRKGTGSGYAEVDFVGTDHQPYRARWSVRRAREKVDGAFQDQSMELRDLATLTPIGRGNAAVLAAIEERLGLSFEQFRRSVLLAQGDFAAFLMASQAERAALLEQMTGSEIYTRISSAAFERAQEATRRLEERRARAADLAVLTSEQREAVQIEHARAATEADDQRRLIDGLEAARAWHAASRALRAELRAGEDEASAAAGRWEATAAPREELAAIERARGLDGPVRSADAALVAANAAGRELEAASVAEVDATRGEEVARVAFEAAAARVSEAEAALYAREPEIQEATLLDAEEAACRQQVGAADAVARESSDAATRARAVVVALATEHTGAVRARREAEAELERRGAYGRLATEWERWQQDLRRHRAASDDLGRVDLPALVASASSAREGARLAAERCSVTEAALAAAARELEAKELLVSGFDRGALRAHGARLAGERKQLDALHGALVDARRHRDAARKARGEAEAAEGEAAQALEAADAARTESGSVESRLAEARRAVDLVRASLDLADRRADLRPGEPCPLCGAVDHPWRDQSPPAAPVVKQLEARTRELEDELTALTKREAAARARHDLAARQATTARARGDEEGAGAVLSAGRASEIGARVGVAAGDAELAAEGVPPTLADAYARLDAADAELARTEEEADRADQVSVAARKERDAVQAQLDRDRAAHDRSARALDAASRSLAEAEGAVARADVARRRAEEDLSPAFEAIAGWQGELARDASTFVGRLDSSVREWRQWRAAAASATAAEEALRPRAEVAEATALGAEERALADERARHEKDSAWKERVERRARLLGGVATSLFERALRGAVDAARREEALARAALQTASVGRAEASARRAAAASASAASVAASIERAVARDAALAAACVDLETARRLLAHDAGWVAEQAARFDGLRKERERTRTVVEERTARLASHELRDRPALDEAEVESGLEAARTALGVVEPRLFSAKHRLENDDAARARLAGFEEELRQLEAASRVWSAMSDLIGSKDGKKLRVFAQSLTFDALLEQANVHLRDISRRYSLMRIPGSDLELQVIDHDMADEVRAVTSLSGGESFLVSLALALGLSTLGAQRTRVESLFVDEGFGTLDPETLEVAIASLEALQASGRQVGVISHVAGLADRFAARIRVERKGPGRSAVIVERG